MPRAAQCMSQRTCPSSTVLRLHLPLRLMSHGNPTACLAAFGTSYGAFRSELAAWLLLPLLFTFCGAAFPLIGLPATRIYAPLERITGFSFAYACSTGFLGG